MLAFHGLGIGKHKFRHYDLGIPEGVDSTHVVDHVFVLKTAYDVHDGIYFTNVCEKFVSQTFSLAGALN